jgi:hypothetical protein
MLFDVEMLARNKLWYVLYLPSIRSLAQETAAIFSSSSVWIIIFKAKQLMDWFARRPNKNSMLMISDDVITWSSSARLVPSSSWTNTKIFHDSTANMNLQKFFGSIIQVATTFPFVNSKKTAFVESIKLELMQ